MSRLCIRSIFSPPKFKRLTGVKREVFDLMLEVIESLKAATRKHPTRSIPPKLSIADKLLMLLMYYREYRTLFHTGTTLWYFRKPYL